jgi:hypothetical protein
VHPSVHPKFELVLKVVGASLCRLMGSRLNGIIQQELRPRSRLADDRELSRQGASRDKYWLHNTRWPGHVVNHLLRSQANVEQVERLAQSIKLDLGDGFCTMSAATQILNTRRFQIGTHLAAGHPCKEVEGHDSLVLDRFLEVCVALLDD